MMTRNELRKLKCWGCWWQEGSRCYNQRIAVIICNDEEHLQEGKEITEELLVKCEKKDRVSKRDVLEQYFEGGALTIVSEVSDVSGKLEDASSVRRSPSMH